MIRFSIVSHMQLADGLFGGGNDSPLSMIGSEITFSLSWGFKTCREECNKTDLTLRERYRSQ